jgi:hypothetical protein
MISARSILPRPTHHPTALELAMQLTLLTPFARPAAAAAPAPQRGPVSPTREAAALSQLDRIAAQNPSAPAQGLGGSGVLLALLGGLLVVGSATMWRDGGEVREARSATAAEQRDISAPAVAAVTPAPPVPSAVVVAEAVTPAAAAHSTPPPAVLEPAPAAAVAAADPAADEAARKARVKQLADARRKAAQLAQERAAAEEAQRLQLAQQRESERAAQQLAEQARQRAAAEQARSPSLQLALDTRRSVGDACAGGGFISRQFCRARECAKPDHQGDPVCISLREDELAQQRASNSR